MSYLLSSALTAAVDAPPLALKIAAFAGFCAEVLQGHDATYAVSTYVSDAVTEATSRKQRVAVMGDPARYCEVLYAGDEGTWETDDDVRHAVDVFVYHGVGTADRADALDAFRAALESRDTSTPGLLHAIRAQGSIHIVGTETDTDGDAIAEAAAFAGREMTVQIPTGVRAALVFPENHPQDDQYECAFRVLLT